MTIETLIEVVPPPATPFEAFDGPWEPIEAELGTVLPQDYKNFVRLYGNGSFMEFLCVHTPTSGSIYVRLAPEVRTICKNLLIEDDLPYPLWPAPGGLLPLGKTDFGDYLFWLPRGPPADWKIVVWGRGLGQFEVFDCDLTDFLAGLAIGDMIPEDFPSHMLPCDHLFRPFSDWPARE
ncbi:SMI1/KNR4 family protein [Phenylobacterium sp.]|uniref:SMI1/KNR4 family protein n=1 Tax=Phenylobacterium sp. TaxID=1871053 RepID=UPI00286BA472|nr:SMI1/KNR4 family protein [Phenylobacterium sp.]